MELILMSVLGSVTFLVGVKYSLNEMEKQIEVWDSNYQEINDKAGELRRACNSFFLKS